MGWREETMKKGERAGNTRNGRREILDPPVAPGNIIVGEYDLLQTLNNMIKLQEQDIPDEPLWVAVQEVFSSRQIFFHSCSSRMLDLTDLH